MDVQLTWHLRATERAHRGAPDVLIVNDHAAFQASTWALLQAEGFDIVGEAADGAGAVEAVAVLRPEVVLLDIQLGDLMGSPWPSSSPECRRH